MTTTIRIYLAGCRKHEEIYSFKCLLTVKGRFIHVNQIKLLKAICKRTLVVLSINIIGSIIIKFWSE